MKTNTLILGATGGVGYAVAKAQLDKENPVTVLVRDVKKAYNLLGNHSKLEIIEGDALDSVLLNRLAEGKTHIFHGLNASYEYWEEFMPLATRKVIEAAIKSGATVVFPGNIYNYGNITEPATEVTPFKPESELGKLRLKLELQLEQATRSGRIKALVVRLPEMWGMNVTNAAFAPVFENAINGKSIPWLYTADVPQQMVWNMDAGRAVSELMEWNPEHSFETVHYAGSEVHSMYTFFSRVCKAVGSQSKTKVLGSRMIRCFAFNKPVLRKVQELEYKYRNTILLDDSRFHNLIPEFEETPLEEAIRDTVEWFRVHRVEPAQTEKKKNHSRYWLDFMSDNTAIVLFPVLIAAMGTLIPFIGNNAVLFGVVAGIYWAPGLRALSRKLFGVKSMKVATAVLFLLITGSAAMAQSHSLVSKPWERTQTFASFGLSLPVIHGGAELMQSKSLRDESLSYFEDGSGNRRSVGNYPALIGWAAQIGFYRPVSFAERLMLGATFTSSLTGSSPSSGGYEEGYFFNSILFGGAWKYYLTDSGRIALKGDAGIASVFTKNRFKNESGQQEFFHQFGIGAGASLGFSWEFSPRWSIELTHSLSTARVEVNGIGDDNWTYGTTNVVLVFWL